MDHIVRVWQHVASHFACDARGAPAMPFTDITPATHWPDARSFMLEADAVSGTWNVVPTPRGMLAYLQRSDTLHIPVTLPSALAHVPAHELVPCIVHAALAAVRAAAA
ncbi:hypothetical protein EON67_02855 [archaeon]|nr:MAG: hypothetical protein EON67_02855 [archaeon]